VWPALALSANPLLLAPLDAAAQATMPGSKIMPVAEGPMGLYRTDL
jgi:hypothetical protein